MKKRPSHTGNGITFVIVCCVIAGLIYMAFGSGIVSIDRVPDNAQTGAPGREATTGGEALPSPIVDVDDAALASAETEGATPQLGDCHMGECSWSRELERQTVRQEAVGRLVRLRLAGGTSAHADNDYPTRFSPTVRIQWNTQPHDVYVFCSTRLPATVMQADGEWQVDVLDFASGIPGVLTGSADLYAATCHGIGTVWGDEGFAGRYGYQPLPNGAVDTTVGSPEDLFDRARALASDTPQ